MTAVKERKKFLPSWGSCFSMRQKINKRTNTYIILHQMMTSPMKRAIGEEGVTECEGRVLGKTFLRRWH